MSKNSKKLSEKFQDWDTEEAIPVIDTEPAEDCDWGTEEAIPVIDTKPAEDCDCDPGEGKLGGGGDPRSIIFNYLKKF